MVEFQRALTRRALYFLCTRIAPWIGLYLAWINQIILRAWAIREKNAILKQEINLLDFVQIIQGHNYYY